MDTPLQYSPGSINEQVISLLDITATTLWMAGIEKPAGMHSQLFLGENTDPSRTYAFSARDRIDETVLRMRSVRGKRFHYIRNYSEGQGFAALNRYKEKCFAIKPLMRQLMDDDLLVGPALELMQPMPYELLYDSEEDPHEINNLATSENPEYEEVLMRMRDALDTWEAETDDLGRWPEPDEIISPFEKEMHDWFGTPDWYDK
jgi:arylsulfatase A-like enzyme